MVLIDPALTGTVSFDPYQNTYQAGDLITVTARAAEGWVFSSWESNDIVIEFPEDTTLALTMPESDVDVTAVFVEQAPEVFAGDFSGEMGTFSASNGCAWSLSVSGTITLTLEPSDDGAISGTAEFCADLFTNIIAGDSCTNAYWSVESSGALSGTDANFGGSFADTAARPVNVVLTAVRNGDQITCTLRLTKVIQILVDSHVDGYATLSTTVSVAATKQQ
jgi:hypothetical protein